MKTTFTFPVFLKNQLNLEIQLHFFSDEPTHDTYDTELINYTNHFYGNHPLRPDHYNFFAEKHDVCVIVLLNHI